MPTSFCVYFLWRRKITILLTLLTLSLLTFWTWTFINDNRNLPSKIRVENKPVKIVDKHENFFTLQKLILEANRIESHEKHTKDLKRKATFYDVSAATHVGKNLVSSQAQRKRAPILGENYLFENKRLKILENQQRARNNADFEDFNNNLNNMDYERMMSSSERQAQYEHELQRMGVPVVANIGPDGPRAPNERLVHLDLKGAAPKLSFLKNLLGTLKTLGATGLLIEYEDMFPYTDNLQEIPAKNAYKMEELIDFLQAAAFHGLSVMPLVQTFGHMEYVLKLQGFDHMREIPESPQSICPSQQDSLYLIESMLKQIIEFHLSLSNSTHSNDDNNVAAGAKETPLKFTHIHIGCDEVYRIGECKQCRLRSRKEIFLTHVTTIANFIRTHWPHLRVVIWDDMLRDVTLSEMQHSNIGSYVEPMIWVYVSDIYHFITPQLWNIYSKIFPTAWAASAFKGAFGESLMIPPLQRHLENNIHWLAAIAKEGGRFSKGFMGLVLTGWQRYDHFAVLCELLPVSMPSLITSLSTVSKGYFSINPKDNDILRVIECDFHPDSRRSGYPWIELNVNSHHSQLFISCSYVGSFVYKFALRLFDKLMEVQNYLTHVQNKSAWMSDYNVRHNFSSPLHIEKLTSNTPRLIHDLTAMAHEAHQIMFDVFDEFTIIEFIEQNIYPSIVSLHRHLENGHNLAKQRVWHRRPLPYARELVDLKLIPSAPQ